MVNPNPRKLDPTRTLSLRKKFVGDLFRRLSSIKRDVDDLLLGQDALNGRWVFRTDQAKVDEFGKWLSARVDFRLIGNNPSEIERNFWAQYIEEGYEKGAGRAYQSFKGSKAVVLAAKQEFLRGALSSPESVSKLELLVGRTFTDLKGIGEVTATQLQRTLADGLVRGQNPRVIARTIAQNISRIKRTRAEVLAQTEIIRAHASGQLLAFKELGVEEIRAEVEWSTAGDNRVCPKCVPLEGLVVKVSKAEGMIPRHPRCRCTWIPANVGENRAKQLRIKSQVKASIGRSIKAEKPNSRKSLTQLKRESTWIGADHAK